MENTKLFSRNFNFLILGQVSSLFGNYILRLALSMYILEITGSAAIFAGLLSVATIPVILLSPLGGILADRANRRNIMVGLDFLSGVTTVCMILLFNESNAIFIIGSILIILSILGAFESPTVQACVPQMQIGDNIIKANAVINQISAISALVAPILGSILYTTFGLQKILLVCAVCFFLTALLECFIQLEYKKNDTKDNILATIRSDFITSIRFITKEQKSILKVLLLAATMNFLLVGIGVVGLPYIIRTVLGLGAEYYGVAESLLGLSTIVGSLVVSVLVTKLKPRKLYLLLFMVGIAILPIAIAFLFHGVVIIKYAITVVSVFIVQLLACVFSIFALSIIQRKTPNELLGKTMAYVSTITLCAQPLGQLLYGFLYDSFSHSLFWIFLITGIATCYIGLISKKIFKELDDDIATDNTANTELGEEE